MNHIESVEYIQIPGNITRPKLRLYSQTTCTFCAKGREFLESRGYQFEYINMDTLDKETRINLKSELKEKYGRIDSIPFLTIDGKTGISGYNTEKWEQMLGTADSKK